MSFWSKLICVKILQITSKPVSTLYNGRGYLVTTQVCVARIGAVTKHCQFLFSFESCECLLSVTNSPRPSYCFPSLPFSPLGLFFKCYIATTLPCMVVCLYIHWFPLLFVSLLKMRSCHTWISVCASGKVAR